MRAGHNGAERAGQWIGRRWRTLVRQDARATNWLVNQGLPRYAAASLSWIVKLGFLAILMYAAFWLTLLVTTILFVATAARRVRHEEKPRWLEKDRDDPREELFYHPLSHNHDPDPRFYDPRHDGK